MNHKDNSRLTFDFKGSTISRYRDLTKKQWKKIKEDQNCDKVLKDMNYLEILLEKKNLMQLSLNDYTDLSEIIQKDSEFLKSLGIMDYSLLMVIEKKTITTTESLEDNILNKNSNVFDVKSRVGSSSYRQTYF